MIETLVSCRVCFVAILLITIVIFVIMEKRESNFNKKILDEKVKKNRDIFETGGVLTFRSENGKIFIDDISKSAGFRLIETLGEVVLIKDNGYMFYVSECVAAVEK